jgi:response regulator RpfG family c-di-GMP phosphodiesterase
MSDTLSQTSTGPVPIDSISGIPIALDSPPGSRATFATVLCVDDEPNILAALKRMLRADGLCVLTAAGGAQALSMLEQMPVDLVISDMRMPGMDGAQFLEQVHLRWPHVVRVMLTGHADISATVAAINRGRIFRYVHKPWDEHDLMLTVRQGLEMHRLEAERQRLDLLTRQQNDQLQAANTELERRVEARTVELKDANVRLQRSHLKTIKAFADLIELRSGGLSGHGRRVADMARRLARHMGLAEPMVLDIFKAGLLHDIGLVGATDIMLSRSSSELDAPGSDFYRAHASRGAQALCALDDMTLVAQIVEAHHERFDGLGFPAGLAAEAIPLGARILAVADALDDLEYGASGDIKVARADAIAKLLHEAGARFDPDVLGALDTEGRTGGAPDR